MKISSACQQVWLGIMLFSSSHLFQVLAQTAISKSLATKSPYNPFPTQSIGDLTSAAIITAYMNTSHIIRSAPSALTQSINQTGIYTFPNSSAPRVILGSTSGSIYSDISATNGRPPFTSASGSPRNTGTAVPSKTTASESNESGSLSTTSLPTIPAFPIEPPSTITNATVTSNSKTTQSSGDHTIVLPVLPKHGHDSGLCWFCSPFGEGFILSGFSKPGVYPTGNLPGFEQDVPQITIGPDLVPTFSPEPSGKPTISQGSTNGDNDASSKSDPITTGTSSACSATTISNCRVTTAVSVSDSSTKTDLITSCATQVACSAHGTTIASATTTTAGGCWLYDYSIDTTNPSSEDAVAKRDDLDMHGHRVHWHARRGKAKSVIDWDTCQAATAAGGPALTIPAYPSARNLEKQNGASWWYVPTTTQVAQQNCPIVTMTSFANLASLRAQPVMGEVKGGSGIIYQDRLRGPGRPYVDVDHVYELSLMKDFIAAVLNSNAVSCQDFNNFFMRQDPNTQNYRLQLIYDQLPSYQFPDFAGMDHDMNELKGKMFNKELKDFPNAHSEDERLQRANQVAAAIDFTNSNGIARLFKNANSRIYNAWKGVDNLIAGSCGGIGPVPNGGKWADAYSTWMTDWLQSRNAEITAKISSLTSTGAESPASITEGFKAFINKYPQASWGWDETALLDWTVNAPLAIHKRDGEVCSLTAPETAQSVSATTTPGPSNPNTLTGTNSTTQADSKAVSTMATTSSSQPTSTFSQNTTLSTSGSQTSTSSTQVATSNQTSISSQNLTSTQASTESTSSSTSSMQDSSESSSTPSTTGNQHSPTIVQAPVPSSSAVAAADASACKGNQVAGSCTQAHLPSTSPDSGIQSLVCNKVNAGGSSYVRFNDAKAKDTAKAFCDDLVSKKILLDAGTSAPNPGSASDACENNGKLSVSVVFDVDSCDEGTSKENQKVDFGAMGGDTCLENLYGAISLACAQDSTWGDYNKDYTLEGGAWAGGCALWDMSGSTA